MPATVNGAGIGGKTQVMKALITLNGVYQVGDRPQSLLNVEFEDEKKLIDKLKKMQGAYSLDGKDKPKIQRHDIPSKKYPGKNRKVIDCSTYSDWHHVAHLGVTSPSVSIEILK